MQGIYIKFWGNTPKRDIHIPFIPNPFTIKLVVKPIVNPFITSIMRITGIPIIVNPRNQIAIIRVILFFIASNKIDLESIPLDEMLLLKLST